MLRFLVGTTRGALNLLILYTTLLPMIIATNVPEDAEHSKDSVASIKSDSTKFMTYQDLYKVISSHSLTVSTGKSLLTKIIDPKYEYIGSDRANFQAQVLKQVQIAETAYDELNKMYESKYSKNKVPPEGVFQLPAEVSSEAKRLATEMELSKNWFSWLAELLSRDDYLKIFPTQMQIIQNYLEDIESKLPESEFSIMLEIKAKLAYYRTKLEEASAFEDKFRSKLVSEFDSLTAGTEYGKDTKFVPPGPLDIQEILEIRTYCQQVSKRFDYLKLLAVESDNEPSDEQVEQMDSDELKRAKAHLKTQRKNRIDAKMSLNENIKKWLSARPEQFAWVEFQGPVYESINQLKDALKKVQDAKLEVKNAKEKNPRKEESVQAIFAGNNLSTETKSGLNQPPLDIVDKQTPEQETIDDSENEITLEPNANQKQPTSRRPFYTKKLFYIPASLALVSVAIGVGWKNGMFDCGSQDMATTVMASNSTTITIKDAPKDSTMYLIIAIIVVVVLILLAVVYFLLMQNQSNGTGDLECGDGKMCAKDKTTSTKATSTITGAATPVPCTSTTFTHKSSIAKKLNSTKSDSSSTSWVSKSSHKSDKL